MKTQPQNHLKFPVANPMPYRVGQSRRELPLHKMRSSVGAIPCGCPTRYGIELTLAISEKSLYG
ncbi:hypothetical protein THIOM_005181 [Candidatus Thiomargarita nelsonii]|uniref:Uncharacterized protein n=1 Tax=Candidatus Thiomargarita nelsonii TaxID=1003181 RepID=A0A176RTX7_9GAMM|nr:hypothetical protein THIOM_005181 [Candidatus Thiomargarita nelsonii]